MHVSAARVPPPQSAPADPAGPAIAVVLKGYPRLSETFIAQELLGLEQRGHRLVLVSLRRADTSARHPVHEEIAAAVNYLPEYLHREPRRVWRAWRRARRLPGYRRCLRLLLRDFARERTRNRLRRFGQALVLASELPPSVRWLYAHFVHTPASVARYCSELTGLPWSCSAHAKDVWTTPAWELRDKLAACRWLVTCTGANRDYLGALAPGDGHVRLLYHGLDFARFPDPGPRQQARDGSSADRCLRILTVGRAVAKKGFEDLLHALGALPRDWHWRLVHVGGGEQLARLQALARELGIDGAIDWRGALAQRDVLACYRNADLFVLPSRIAADGDRDGLPNVLMEAQSQRLACISTTVSGIPELIRADETGKLLAPGEPAALAAALLALGSDPRARRRLGDAGFEHLRRHFSHAAGLDRLHALFPAC